MTQKELAHLMSSVFNIMIMINKLHYIVCSETTIHKFSFQFIISLYPIYV